MDVAEMQAADHEDRWYVTNGVVAVGPVAFEMLRRGIAAGRIPQSSFIRHESWKVWRRLEDIRELSKDTLHATVERLGALSSGAERRASNPYNEAPRPNERDSLPPPPSGERGESAEPAPTSAVRPVVVDPVGVLATAADLGEALLLALSTAVSATSAEAGLLMRARPELHATVISYTHGPGTEALLGERLVADDPSLLAAQAGRTVLGEPQPGPAARWIIRRFRRVGVDARSVVMVPILLRGELVGSVEIAVRRALTARDAGRVEDIVEALVARMVERGWSR
jgi:hypothetical protein